MRLVRPADLNLKSFRAREMTSSYLPNHNSVIVFVNLVRASFSQPAKWTKPHISVCSEPIAEVRTKSVHTKSAHTYI